MVVSLIGRWVVKGRPWYLKTTSSKVPEAKGNKAIWRSLLTILIGAFHANTSAPLGFGDVGGCHVF
jgi:hypothetical protein